MESSWIQLERHPAGVTLYLAGSLCDLAATQAAALIGGLPESARVLRVDLRGVTTMEPESFVSVVRALAKWRRRHDCEPQLLLQFPDSRTSRRAYPAASAL
jgi:hypothetical protein